MTPNEIDYQIKKIASEEEKRCHWCSEPFINGIKISRKNSGTRVICDTCLEKGELRIFKSLKRTYIWFGITLPFFLAYAGGTLGLIIMLITGDKFGKRPPLFVILLVSLLTWIFFIIVKKGFKRIRRIKPLREAKSADLQAYYREILFGHEIRYYHQQEALNKDNYFNMQENLQILDKRRERAQQVPAQASLGQKPARGTRETFITSNPKWKCPSCGAILGKSGLGKVFFPGEATYKVQGSGTCGQCNRSFSASDIYGGKYDVEG